MWGRNHKGQLGIGTNEQSSRPVEVVKLHTQNIRLKDIQWGMTFTLGLTTKNKLMFYGDRRFCTRPQQTQNDIYEPIELDKIDEDIESISVWYNKVLALTKKGIMYHWGDYLESTKNGQIREIPDSKLSKERISQKSDVLMRSIKTGPNHSWAISFNQDLYSWGIDRLGSTGLLIKKDQYTEKKDRLVLKPKVVSTLAKKFQENENRAANRPEEIRRKAEMENEFSGDETPSYEEEKEESKGILHDSLGEELENIDAKTNKTVKTAKSKVTAKTGKSSQRRKGEKSKYGKEYDDAIDPNEIYYELEIDKPRKFIQRTNIQSLSYNKNEKFYTISKILRDEKENNWDETAILKLNRKLNKKLDSIIENLKECMLIEDERRKFKLHIESSFISRVSYNPYKVHDIYRDKNLIYGKILNQNLEIIKNVFTWVYLHPCYLRKIIDNHLLPDDEIYQIITELYRSNSGIQIWYLISYALTALSRDIERVGELEGLNLQYLPSLEDEKAKAKEEEIKKANIK